MLGGNVVTFEFVKRAANAVGRTLVLGLNCGCWPCCRLNDWVTNWTLGPDPAGPDATVTAVAGLTAAGVLSKLCCC